MTQATLDKYIQGWAEEASRDVIGLWNLCLAARRDFGAKTPAEIKTLSLSFVRELLAKGVHAINIGDGRPWPDQRPESVIERISREWDALGHEPDVPDIVWFKKQS